MMYRHGDVLLVKREALPEGAAALPRKEGKVILALGEATGHAHAIATERVELFEVNGAKWMVAPAEWTVTHAQHKPITGPAGVWEVIIQREWSDDDEPIRVWD